MASSRYPALRSPYHGDPDFIREMMKSPEVYKKKNQEIFYRVNMDDGKIRAQYIPVALASDAECRRYLPDAILDDIIPPWREYWRGEKVLNAIDEPFRAEFEAFFLAERAKYSEKNVSWPSSTSQPNVVSGSSRSDTKMPTIPEDMELNMTFYSDQNSDDDSDASEKPADSDKMLMDEKVSRPGPSTTAVPTSSATHFDLKHYYRLMLREIELDHFARRSEATERAMENCITQMQQALKEASALRRDCTDALEKARSELSSYELSHRDK